MRDWWDNLSARQRTLVTVGVLVVLVLLFNGGEENGASPTGTVTNVQESPDEAGSGTSRYVSEYGGVSSVYEDILRSSDCNYLQDQFDTAASNNDREEPGTSRFRATLGYMTAADDRLAAVGCYD